MTASGMPDRLPPSPAPAPAPAPAQPPRVPQIGMTRAATSRNHFRRLLEECERKLSNLRRENEKLRRKLYRDRAKCNRRIQALDEFADILAGEDLPRDYARWARIWDAIGEYYKEQLSKVWGDLSSESKAFRYKERELVEDIRALRASIGQMNAVIRDYHD